MQKKLVLGISSCLLGERVRFDGGHKRDTYLCDLLANYVDFLPICPEVEIGLGIPRPAIQLRGDPLNPRLVEVKNHQKEYSEPMRQFSLQSMSRFEKVSGYILKSKSPSCGLKRVKVYQENGRGPLVGKGLFARILEAHYPNLPIEEEGRLNDPLLRENFIERIFVYQEWQDLVHSTLTPQKLVDFHTRHKLTLLAHSPVCYKRLGQGISQLKESRLPELSQWYIHALMSGLILIATPKKHANVLQHCLGYFKKILNPKDKQELLLAIDQYRCGLLPLIVPITLLKHHLMHHPEPYLTAQSYLAPYPEELMLRNHI
ncbi:MAG: DUF523 and DUF1722 domain-containing protein [Tatlockia sp.]|jgi:uncharacterized protein YbgA (DUF1722 family)/uncharacterized protein YbbK (DUF523 family)